MSPAIHTADTIIIGGGLHGCSTAIHLSLAGLNTIILEKDHIGRHASSANAGGVRRLGRALPEIPLAEEALKHWHHIADLVDDDCGFISTDQIKLAENEAEILTLQQRSDELQKLGFLHEEMIDQLQLRELLPAVAPHCKGGMIVRGDGYANPSQTVRAFERKAAALGTRIFEHHPVISLQRRGSGWQVQTEQSAFEAPVVVNCAGAWGGQIATMAGDFAPVEPRALMLMITERVRPFIRPVVGTQGRALSFKQFTNGTVLIGGGYQGNAVPQNNLTHLNFKNLATNVASAVAVFPLMAKTRIVRSWAGIEGVMPDNIPVIGMGSEAGIFHAFGFSAHGFALAPVVGEIIAHCITRGSSSLAIDAFDIARFAAGPGRYQAAEKTST
ncbi:MAG: FAD-binding oxidoreductase [Granulosicoccaceae bacterium]